MIEKVAPLDLRVIVATAFIALAAGVTSLFPIFDSDVFWHLRTGQEIVAARAIERHDVYSHTASGRAFHNHEWLADLAMAGTYAVAGFDGLIVAKAALVVLLMIALAWAAWERGATGQAIPLALLYALLLSNYRFMVKPELFTFLGVATLDAAANRYFRSGRRRWLVVPPLLVAIWVNVHIGVVMAIAVVAAHAVGETLARRLGWSPAGGLGRPHWLYLTLAWVTLATLLNPYGLEVFEPVLKIYRSSAVQSISVREWEPPTFAAFALFYVLAPIATLIVVLVPRRLRPQDAALWLAGLGLALVSLRHVALFGVMSAPILARHLALLASALATGGAKRLPSLAPAWSPWVRVVATVGIAGLLVPRTRGPHASVFQQDQARHFRFGFGVDRGVTPVESVELIERLGLTGPLYNSYHLGGYVIWRSWPRLEVFLDGRHYVYETLLADLAPYRDDRLKVMEKYGIRLALVAHTDVATAAALATAPSFRLVGFDDAASVYVRMDELVRPDAVPTLDPLVPFDLTLSWLEPERTSEALTAARQATVDSPASARAWFLLGAIAARLHHEALSLAGHERAAELDPSQMSYRNNLGRLQLARGDRVAAERSFVAARALDPASASPVYNHALVLAQRGDTAAALDLLRQVVGMKGAPAEAWLSLGLLEPDTQLARSSLERYLEVGTDAASRDRASAKLRDFERGASAP